MVWFSVAIKGKNSILCFVRTPTRCVWRCPGAVLGIGEDQQQENETLSASVSQYGKL